MLTKTTKLSSVIFYNNENLLISNHEGMKNIIKFKLKIKLLFDNLY